MAEAAPIAGLVVYIDDDTARFTSGMRRAEHVVSESSSRMARSVQGIDRAVGNLNTKMGRFDASAFRNTAREILFAENGVKRLQSSFVLLTGTIAGFTTAQMTMQLGKVADTYTTIQNKIATVVEGTEARRKAEEAVFAIAQRTRSSFEGTATLYQRISASAPSLAANQANLLRVIETIQKSFVVAGSTTQEAKSAAVQLAQGLASGRLQGDELRSILENNIPLAQILAKELAGGDIGKLREMGTEGKLNAEAVTQAILKGTAAIDRQFAATAPRIADGWQAIDNAFIKYIGDLDKHYGASEKLARGLLEIARNFDEIGRAAGFAAAAMAGIFMARRIGNLGQGAAGSWQALRQQRLELVANAKAAQEAARAQLEAAKIERMVARDNLRTLAGSPTFRQAPAQDQAAYQRAAIQRDKAASAAAAASEKEAAGLQRMVAAQNAAIPSTRALEKAQADLVGAQKRVAEAAVRAASDPGVSRRSQNNLYKALFDEAAIREQAAKAEATMKDLVARQQRIANTLANPKAPQAVFQKQAAENAAARAAQEKEIQAINRQLEQAQRQTARAQDAIAKEQAAGKRANNAQLIAAEKQLTAAQTAELTARQSRQQQALAQQAALDAQQVQLRRARVAAERQLAAAEQALTNATFQVGSGARGAVNDARRRLEDARQHVAAIQSVQNATTAAAAAAAAQATILGRAMATSATLARGAFTGLIGLLGGPLGAVLTAGIGLWAIYEYRQSANAAATARQEEAFKNLKSAMEELNRSGSANQETLIMAQANLAIATEGAKSKFEALAASIKGTFLGAFTGGPINELSTALHEAGVATYGFQANLAKLTPGTKEAEQAIETMIAELIKLGSTRTDLSQPIAEMLKALRAAMMTTQGIRNMMNALRDATAFGATPKGVDTSMRSAAGREDLQFTDEQKKAVDAQTKWVQKQIELRREAGATTDALKQQNDVTKAFNDIVDTMGPLVKPSDYEWMLTQAKERVALEKAIKDMKGGGKSKADPTEKAEMAFAERLERLQEEGKAAFFSELDRELIEKLVQMKANPDLIAAVRVQLENGEAITDPQALAVRAALLAKDAGKEYRSLIEKYGEGAQILPMVTDHQTKLNYALERGKISSLQAGVAMADFLGKFKDYKWIDDLTNALGSFVEKSLMDFKNIGDAFKALTEDIKRMLIQTFVTGPLKELIKGGLGNMMGSLVSGGFTGNPMQLLGAKFHSGGIVGVGGVPSLVPAAAFANAPRFHGGFGPREMPAILERGERVYTEAQDRRRNRMMGELADAARDGGGRGGNVDIQIITPPGHTAETQRSRGPNGSEQVKVLVKQIMQEDLATNGDVSQTMQGMFGLNRTAGR